MSARLLRLRLASRALAAGGAARGYAAAAASRPAGQLHICGTAESGKLGVGDSKDRETPVLLGPC